MLYVKCCVVTLSGTTSMQRTSPAIELLQMKSKRSVEATAGLPARLVARKPYSVRQKQGGH
jgi:hypothetical protein